MQNSPEIDKASTASTVKALSEVSQSINKGTIMSNSTEVTTNRAITVPFHGADLYVVEHNGQPYTPMKPVVLGMGLDWAAQFSKLKANPSRWGIAEIAIPTISGVQSMICLPLRKLFGWLSGINIGKIRESLRERVTVFQNECDDALWQYWNDGVAVNPRIGFAVNLGDVLTADEAETLRLMLKSAVERAPKEKQGTLMMQGWSKLKSHFKVSYREIPRHEFSEAVSIIARHTAEWEVLDDEPQFAAINPLEGKGMKEARQVALNFVDGVRQAARNGEKIPHMEAIPGEVLAGILSDAMMHSRFMVTFNFLNGGLQLVPVAKTASVIDLEGDDYTTLAGNVPMERLSELLDALNYRVKTHLGAFGEHLAKVKRGVGELGQGTSVLRAV